MEQELLTQEEFARLVRVSLRTVKNWVATGAIKYWQPGRSGVIRIPRSELSRHLHDGFKVREDDK